jgi:hypothetical protein
MTSITARSAKAFALRDGSAKGLALPDGSKLTATPERDGFS